MPDEVRLIPCTVCSVSFDANSRNFGKGKQLYCGAQCRKVADNRRHYRRNHPLKSEPELRRVCVICGVTFVAHYAHPNALTCSVKCNETRMNAERRRMSAERYDAMGAKQCTECGATFTPGKYAVRTGPRVPKFCSDLCAHRATQRAFYQRTGRKGNQRLGSSQWKIARKKALERDARTCRLCETCTSRMSVHHLFDEHDHGLDNLITVCGSCHHDLHRFVLAKVDGQVVISGAIFTYLGIEKLEVSHP